MIDFFLVNLQFECKWSEIRDAYANYQHLSFHRIFSEWEKCINYWNSSQFWEARSKHRWFGMKMLMNYKFTFFCKILLPNSCSIKLNLQLLKKTSNVYNCVSWRYRVANSTFSLLILLIYSVTIEMVQEIVIYKYVLILFTYTWLKKLKTQIFANRNKVLK